VQGIGGDGNRLLLCPLKVEGHPTAACGFLGVKAKEVALEPQKVDLVEELFELSRIGTLRCGHHLRSIGRPMLSARVASL
jgi:hypothetical protein